MKWQYNDTFDLGAEFCSVPVSVLQSPDISGLAKAVFAYMQSKPSGYQFASKRMAGEFKEGYRKMRAAIIELEELGLLEREKLGNGRMLYKLHCDPLPMKPVEAVGLLNEAFVDMPMREVEHAAVGYDRAKEELGDVEAFEYYMSCKEGELSMDEMTLGKWKDLRA